MGTSSRANAPVEQACTGGCSLTKRCSPSSWRPTALHHLPGRKSAGAEIADFAGADQIVEFAQGLVNRHIRLRPMELVQVKAVRLQAAQRGLATPW